MSRYVDNLIKDFERQRQELVKQHGEDDSFVVCIDTVVIPTIIRIANKNTHSMNYAKKHKLVRIDNLMYDGCEPHWKCVYCGTCIPFHCFTKEQIEQMDCKMDKER